MTNEHNADIAIIGAGAAGMSAAIFAAEAAAAPLRIVLVDGARKPGAKILVSGGGRCNVTNERVTPEDFCGGSRHAIRKVLRAFDERRTREWMESMGVALKLEPTGKYFPVSDKARTVLDALMTRIGELGIELRTDCRVDGIEPLADGGFALTIAGQSMPLRARRVIVATGGKALPKSGSDGVAYPWLAALGHRIIPPVPALAPIVLHADETPGGRLAELAGITLDVRLEAIAPSGARIAHFTGSLLFTHFGLSGPAPMNLSRHLATWRRDHPAEAMPRMAMGHPSLANAAEAETWLRDAAARDPRRHVATVLGELYPERLARLLAGGDIQMAQLPRERRRELAQWLTGLPLRYAGDRGFSFAETTAGGVDLADVELRTMESRHTPGLHLCGEVLDVDGRIGGFNFQWAWATGYLAGRGASKAVSQ